MIQVRGLTKVFPGGPKAVDGLDLDVAGGEILSLLGPNGAGKTTTIRVLTTLSGFDEGQVNVAGFDVDREPDKVRQSIGLVAQNTGIDYFLTGRENLALQGHMYRLRKADIQARIKELAEYFELSDALDRTVATYSGGMRRKLDIATALIHRPKLVFLDEPTLGLDIKSRKMLWNYIQKLNREMGLTILLTTHYLEEADKLSHRVAIISGGKIRALGTPDELKHSIAGEAVTLTFEQQDHASWTFTTALKKTDYVKDVVEDGKRLHLYVAQGAESVPKVTALAAQHGARILTLSLSRPSLDDVFLKYTGSSLEEKAEDSGDEWWKQWAGKGGGGKWAKQWSQWQEQDESNAAGTAEAAGSGAADTAQPSGPTAAATDGEQPAQPQNAGGWGQWTAEEAQQWWAQQQGQSTAATQEAAASAAPQGDAAQPGTPAKEEPPAEPQTAQQNTAAGGWGQWTAEEVQQWWAQQQGQSAATAQEAGTSGAPQQDSAGKKPD